MSDKITDAAKPSKTQAQRALETGAEYPYDTPPFWRSRNACEPPPPARDWAHAAARGVLADLRDRRGVKQGFTGIEAHVRADLVKDLADIIREADLQRGPQLVVTSEMGDLRTAHDRMLSLLSWIVIQNGGEFRIKKEIIDDHDPAPLSIVGSPDNEELIVRLVQPHAEGW